MGWLRHLELTQVFLLPTTDILMSASDCKALASCPIPYDSLYPSTNQHELIASVFYSNSTTKGLYSWNIITNKVSLIYEYTQSQLDAFVWAISTDPTTKKLWILTTNHFLTVDVMYIYLSGTNYTMHHLQAPVDNKSVTFYINEYLPPQASVIAINSWLHMFGGVRGSDSAYPHPHHAYDLSTGCDVKIIKNIADKSQGLYKSVRHSIVYRSKYNDVIIIGGMKWPDAYTNDLEMYDYIWRINLENDVRTLLPTRLPYAKARVCSVLTRNQKDLIMFGGRDGNEKLNEILVYDIARGRIRKSVIECEVKSYFHGICCWNDERKQKIITAWIRREFDEKFPKDLRSVLQTLYEIEVIHLFDLKENQRWMINVDDIYNFDPCTH